MYQLTQTVLNSVTSETYTYDDVGNRTSSLGVTPYTYDSSNQLTATPTATYTYDNNGNTTSKTDSSGVTDYTWDFQNQLIQIDLPVGGTVDFTYDPRGAENLEGLHALQRPAKRAIFVYTINKDMVLTYSYEYRTRIHTQSH